MKITDGMATTTNFTLQLHRTDYKEGKPFAFENFDSKKEAVGKLKRLVKTHQYSERHFMTVFDNSKEKEVYRWFCK